MPPDEGDKTGALKVAGGKSVAAPFDDADDLGFPRTNWNHQASPIDELVEEDRAQRLVPREDGLPRAPVGVQVHRPGQARVPKRSPVAAFWRVAVKPVYNFVTRKLLRTRDSERPRPASGPWPEWTPPLGPEGARRSES